jgi:hypothetical protein
MLTRRQIRELSQDPVLLESFNRLVNAKLRQWQASREFELQAGSTFDALESQLSTFCVMADDSFKGVEEELCGFLLDLASEQQWRDSEIWELEVIDGGKLSRRNAPRIGGPDSQDG